MRIRHLAAAVTLFLGIGLLPGAHALSQDVSYQLRAYWTVPVTAPATPLKTFTREQLLKFKQKGTRERLPGGEKSAEFRGALLSDLVDAVMKDLPAEQKAQVDLLVIKGADGVSALIPRAFVVKYPILLALNRDGKALNGDAPVQTVIPWTSSTKIQGETVSLESFWVNGVKEIEFANYRDRYPQYYLKRRTDPAAMRGEKLFREACITCHASGRGPAITQLTADAKLQVLSAKGHPKVPGMPNIPDAERRKLVTFLEAFRAENQPSLSVK